MTATRREPAGDHGPRSVGRLGRTFHAVDIENLLGTGRPDEASVAALRSVYVGIAGVMPLDQVVVACNRASLVDVGFGWGPSSARYRVGSGRDAADRELLAVLECEAVADRFRHVVIASGDGIFAPMVARVAAAGCEVTVVCRRASLSVRLKMAAKRVVYLPAFGLGHAAASAVARTVA